MKKFLLLFLIAISYNQLNCQIPYKTNIGAGLSTLLIVGDNPNVWSMYDYNENHPSVGGSFDVIQPGIDVRATFTMNEAETMYIPVGFDYIWMQSRERIPSGTFVTARLQNDVNLFMPYLGFQYAFLRLPLASARVYAGAEARLTYLHSANYHWQLDYKNNPEQNREKTIDSKPDAVRLGGAVRLGVMGDLFEPFKINASAAFNVINLIGRDNERGELMTPLKTNETGESLVNTFMFSIIIQYSF